jgi:hypothetical protein
MRVQVSVDHLQEDDANGAAGGDDASGPQRGDPEHTRHSVAKRLRRAQAQLMQARSTRAEAASELEFSEKAESTSYAAAMRSAETKQQAVRPPTPFPPPHAPTPLISLRPLRCWRQGWLHA